MLTVNEKQYGQQEFLKYSHMSKFNLQGIQLDTV
jgi:hypothetical protein